LTLCIGVRVLIVGGWFAGREVCFVLVCSVEFLGGAMAARDGTLQAAGQGVRRK